MGKPYVCYLPIGSFYFKDCDSSYKGVSVLMWVLMKKTDEWCPIDL